VGPAGPLVPGPQKKFAYGTGGRRGGAGCLVQCELTATNQRGEVTAAGQASIALPE